MPKGTSPPLCSVRAHSRETTALPRLPHHAPGAQRLRSRLLAGREAPRAPRVPCRSARPPLFLGGGSRLPALATALATAPCLLTRKPPSLGHPRPRRGLSPTLCAAGRRRPAHWGFNAWGVDAWGVRDTLAGPLTQAFRPTKPTHALAALWKHLARGAALLVTRSPINLASQGGPRKDGRPGGRSPRGGWGDSARSQQRSPGSPRRSPHFGARPRARMPSVPHACRQRSPPAARPAACLAPRACQPHRASRRAVHSASRSPPPAPSPSARRIGAVRAGQRPASHTLLAVGPRRAPPQPGPLRRGARPVPRPRGG
jgi:hypothetical protein